MFIDHSHEYELVRAAALRLEQLLLPGGFCFFHDYNDKRNADPAVEEYGVLQAVDEVCGKVGFEFFGVFGCGVLFRKVS